MFRASKTRDKRGNNPQSRNLCADLTFSVAGYCSFQSSTWSYLVSCKGSNISNTSDSVSLGYPNTEKRVENTTRSGVFLTKFEVFG